MSYTIALAGKGGSGKTTIAALIVRLLRDAGCGSILAVDADPNSNLGEALGIANAAGIGAIIDEIAAHPQAIPAGMTKDRFIEYQVHTAVAEGGGFDLLTMGRPEGPGCYCYANNVLRGVMETMIKDYDYVIIDNEAGLEHLSRRTTRRADTLLVVAQPTAAGLRAAGRISGLARDMNIEIKKQLLLINCSDGETEHDWLQTGRRSDSPPLVGGDRGGEIEHSPSLALPTRGRELRKKLNEMGGHLGNLEHLGFIPRDQAIVELSQSGAPLESLLPDSGALAALRSMGDRIWR